MLIRIVKMTFRPDGVSDFTQLFESRKHLIRNYAGCNHLELWQDQSDSRVFFTYSIWDRPESLEQYRTSHFFNETWQQTKKLFQAKPEAWSVNQLAVIQ
ncbi:antibiotic biosynthesis monooxygenase [Segetibacter sp. 3557_3]|uniref:putative quinol monooxygenase n=1 Tax=Segetibacter sp. 3557_3 TaxID=2547429 RepID=UPI0010590077|nr:antibiotic biosynthesis monooxygenase family protein [Segetibacter sp. 3557_3]TDH29097.1 antibiotic biosynthesis monooxygenase [Segetibacter sp. 3557_3]